MAEGVDRDAERLARAARGDSITPERLRSVGTDSAVGPGNYAHDRPVLAYFGADEQPHYFFYNESKGVTMGEETVKSGWSGNYRNSMWVTDRGVHFLVGREDGDFHEFVPHDAIEDVDARTGITKNRFVLSTADGEYDFPTEPGTDEVPEAGEYISTAEWREPADAHEEPTSDDAAARQGSSGGVPPQTGEGATVATLTSLTPVSERPEHGTPEVSAGELVSNAAGKMKQKHLTKTGGLVETYLYDRPLVDHLMPDERPQYYFKNYKQGIDITARDGTERTLHEGGRRWRSIPPRHRRAGDLRRRRTGRRRDALAPVRGDSGRHGRRGPRQHPHHAPARRRQ